MKKITLSILVLLLIISLTACGKKKTDKPDEDEGPIFTDHVLVENLSTSYKIVIPENASSQIMTAASELVYFFKEATGVEIERITDSSLTMDTEGKYLSIGKTKLYNESLIEVSFDELGPDGFKLVTIDKSVIMIGATDTGSLYAVYEFLETTFDLDVFSKDEFYIKEVTHQLLPKFEVTEVPLFDRRSVGLYTFTEDATFRRRMRQEFYSDGWILWSHSHFTILPPEQYSAQHPDWYNSDMTQLNLTNDEMREEFTRVVIDLVKENKNHTYIMLGAEDHNTFGDSKEELEAVEKYTEAGVLIRFTNQVAEAVQQYIDENEPGRIFYVATFAYFRSENPPVVQEADGSYRAIDPSVIPNENVRIMIAPIYAANSKNFHHEINRETKRVYDGWSAIASGKLQTWIYNKYFNQYFIPFHNFSTLKENYEILANYGVDFIYHQGNKETPAGGLQDLMSYVQAKLMWSLDYDLEELVERFARGFYKEAADAFIEYFDLIRMTFATWQQLYGIEAYNSGTNSGLIYDPKLWTRDLLDQFDTLFEKQMNAIAHYQTTDLDTYETLKSRIDKERLTIEYLYLQFYFHQFSYEETLEKINYMEEVTSKLGIRVWREQYFSVQTDRLMTSLIQKWRQDLNNK